MTEWESGREKSLLIDIKEKRKTVEARLYKDKFKDYKVGDTVRLRSDEYDIYGKLVKSTPNQARVKITKIDLFPNFKEMLLAVGFKKVVPKAGAIDDALSEIYKFYTPKDEAKLGVMAIHFRLIN